MQNLTSEIERFISYFRNEVEQIWALKVEGGGHQKAYKKVLFFAVIDSLSKCIFPKKGNRDRIVAFINEFSDWKNRTKISLPHVSQLLSKSPKPPFSDLRKFTYAELNKWSPGAIIKLDQEPDIKEIAKLWPSEKEHKKPLEGVSIESLQHIHLFYSYRNYLVHELREPGYGFEYLQDEEPFYISFSHLSIGEDEEAKETWKLVYPVLFLKRLIDTCMNKMEKYLIENNINPYMSYTFGTYWIDELNR